MRLRLDPIEPPYGVTITSGALTLLPDEQRAWVQRSVHAGIAPAARVEITSNVTGETTDGWPIQIVEATVTATSGARIEGRIVAFYAFFEHAATAMAVVSDEARLVSARDAILVILHSGRPDWTGEVSCLAELWDVHVAPAPTQMTARDAIAWAPNSELAGAVVRASLESIDSELASHPTADAHAIRAQLLQRLGDRDGAIAAWTNALAIDATHAASHRGLALVHAIAGDRAAAVTAWEAAATADPRDTDALYNLGLAHAAAGDPQRALASWLAAATRAPRDFWIARKIVQGHIAVEQFDEAARARATVAQLWRSSNERAVRLQDEYVIDQFRVGSSEIHAFETLRPRDPTSYALLVFRLVDREQRGARLEVSIETSDYAKTRGAPYVIAILDGDKYRALGTAETLPPYPELRRSVVDLVEKALATRAKS